MTHGYLIDTSSLSQLAPGRPSLDVGIAQKLRAAQDRLFLPSIALAELRRGVCKLRRKGEARRADLLNNWIANLRTRFSDRVLPFDAEAADHGGRIADAADAIGRNPGFADVAIAGIARSRQLAVVTENLRHFEPLGVEVYRLADLP